MLIPTRAGMDTGVFPTRVTRERRTLVVTRSYQVTIRYTACLIGQRPRRCHVRRKIFH